jgi:C1A family cysteine protease
MMTDFMAAYSAWRAKPFPAGSADEALDELHAELATWDTWIASTLVPFIDHGRISRDQVDVTAELNKLARHADNLAHSLDGENLKKAQEYREYADLLSRAYECYLFEINTD